jgi:hypothetical protein
MKAPKNADKFTNVKGWARKGFILHFESRFSNAGEIYDYFNPKKEKKVKAEKED